MTLHTLHNNHLPVAALSPAAGAAPPFAGIGSEFRDKDNGEGFAASPSIADKEEREEGAGMVPFSLVLLFDVAEVPPELLEVGEVPSARWPSLQQTGHF